MKQTTFLLSAFIFPLFSFAQQVTYNDVAVVVNDNSQTSIDIGNYFAQQRNIPSQNIIHVTTTTQEEIDTTQLFDLLGQVSDYLTSNNLADSINYIVTTKGLPLKLANGNCAYTASCSSVESEMSLILSQYSNSIGIGGAIFNPYVNSQVHFARPPYQIFLVTRLDGYSYEDVINLIDRSGPNIPVVKNEAVLIFGYEQFLTDTLTQLGWNCIVEEDTAMLLNQTNVLGLFIYDHNSAGLNLNYDWLRGSIVELHSCYTAGTFDESQNPDNNILVANLIKEGATGANGYPYCIYSNNQLNIYVLLLRYLDEVNHFNLAESYYMATQVLSNPSVIIGDPKTSIVLDTLNGISSVPNAEIKLYPNPSSGVFLVSFHSAQNCDVTVSDLLGKLLWKGQWNATNKIHSLNLQSQPAGIYFLKVKQEAGERVIKIVKE